MQGFTQAGRPMQAKPKASHASDAKAKTQEWNAVSFFYARNASFIQCDIAFMYVV